MSKGNAIPDIRDRMLAKRPREPEAGGVVLRTVHPDAQHRGPGLTDLTSEPHPERQASGPH